MEMKKYIRADCALLAMRDATGCCRYHLEDGGTFQYSGVGSDLWQRLSSSAAVWRFYRDNIEEEFSRKHVSGSGPASGNPLDDLFGKSCYCLIAGVICQRKHVMRRYLLGRFASIFAMYNCYTFKGMYMNKLLSVILAAFVASTFSFNAVAALHTSAAPVMPGDKPKDMQEMMKDQAKEKAKTEVKKEVMKEDKKSGK